MRFFIIILMLILTNPIITNAETFKLTAYCGCAKCCGKWSKYNKTASGTTPQQGRTIAVDKKIIPLGSVVTIDGLGEFIAEDTGVRGKHIDIYFENHQDALNFGVQHKEITMGTIEKEEVIEMTWIPVEKEIPENYVEVLVSIEEPYPGGVDRYVNIGWVCIDNNGGQDWYSEGRYLKEVEARVAAWMPLPTTYKEDNNGE